MKTILTSFDFMQNLDFILTYKIYQNRLLNTWNERYYTFDPVTRSWKNFDFIDFSGP